MSVCVMKRKHEDDGTSYNIQDVMGQTNSNVTLQCKEENSITTLPSQKEMTVSEKTNSLHDGMLLRLTYWLNNTLTKAINAGLYSYSQSKLYEPCVTFTNTNKRFFRITQNEWNCMLTYINEVTLSLENKEKKTIFVPNEDTIAIAVTIKPLFGKMYVTLFMFLDEKLSSPFVLNEDEWNMMVKCIPTVDLHLRKLTHNASIINDYVHSKHTSPEHASDIQAYDTLLSEIKAFC